MLFCALWKNHQWQTLLHYHRPLKHAHRSLQPRRRANMGTRARPLTTLPVRLAPKENFRCPFKYQGQYYDSEVELCYNRFRYYHPETGRYISEDPIKLLGGFNVFAYVGDTNAWVDLLGLSSYAPIHHIATNKHVDWADRFRDLFRQYGLGKFKNGKERKDVLDDPRNKVSVPGHKGPHNEEGFHESIYDRLEKAGREGGTEGFIEELAKMKKECLDTNSEMNKIITKRI